MDETGWPSLTDEENMDEIWVVSGNVKRKEKCEVFLFY